MHRWLLVGFCALTLNALVACGDDTCTGGKNCECVGDCDCDGGSCNFTCEAGEDCTFHCPEGGCNGTCVGNGSCTMDCPGNSCNLTCSSTGSCVITSCASSCALTCNGAATCQSSCDPLTGGCSTTP